MTNKNVTFVWIVCFSATEGWTANFSVHTNKADAEVARDAYAKFDDGADEGLYEIRSVQFNPVFNEE